jgi:hypothetical protein
VPHARIDLDGIKTVSDLREAIGAMKLPFPRPEKYTDDRYYKKGGRELNAVAVWQNQNR